METKRTIQFVLFLLYLSFTLINCSNNSPTEVISLVSSSEQWFGGFKLENIDHLVASNRLGSIYIYGNSLPDTIQSYLYKNVSAETKNVAEEHFSDIVLEHSILNDSVLCSIAAPYYSAQLEYSCNLELEISGELQTYIKSPNNGVNIYYMDTTVYVLDSRGDIELRQHNGSCEVNTSKGDIITEMIIENNGFCRCYTSEGDITVEIPSNTSATIYAITDEGAVSYSNLTISNLSESQGYLSGELSNGQGEIHLETKKGNIEIKGFFTCNDSDLDQDLDIPSGSYHYQSYNSDSIKVVDGWFTMIEDSVANISGEWHFNKIGNPENIGTQVGDGILVGGYNGNTLWIELNPQYKDRNVQLIGIKEDGNYSGRWIWITFSGISAEGSFTANYKE